MYRHGSSNKSNPPLARVFKKYFMCQYSVVIVCNYHVFSLYCYLELSLFVVHNNHTIYNRVTLLSSNTHTIQKVLMFLRIFFFTWFQVVTKQLLFCIWSVMILCSHIHIGTVNYNIWVLNTWASIITCTRQICYESFNVGVGHVRIRVILYVITCHIGVLYIYLEHNTEYNIILFCIL